MNAWKSVMVVAAVIACAPPAGSRANRDNNLITREELLASFSSNAFDAITNLRPNFFRSRGQKTFDPNFSQRPQVILDGQRYGDIEALRALPTQSIMSIRLLSAAEATTKYGTGYPSGIIEVSTTR